MFENPKEEKIFEWLKKAKNIAVVGMSNKEERSSFLIAQELIKAGYTIFPVNPVLAGGEILGRKVYASLSEIEEHIDIVDIFRRSEFLPDIAREFLKTDATVFWAQSGLMSEEAAQILTAHGRRKIIMDRCIKIEWMRMNW